MTPLSQLPVPLLHWYAAHARVLPWRSDPTPYHVLVSEIMLQQTRVAAVLEYYARFMSALPTVQSLADCPPDRLMKLWQGLGYYSRARNLQKAARQVVDGFGGAIPADPKALRTLAGVGEYTAGAVASIAFGQPAAAVDGNVLRVVSRLTGDRREMEKPPVKRTVAAALVEVMPKDRPGDFNQALMDLGAMVCLPGKAPLCGQCPAAGFCTAHREGTAWELPVKPAKAARKAQELTVYMIFRQGKVALRRRADTGLLAGLWEYPNGPAPWPSPVPGKTWPLGRGRHVFTHLEWRMEAQAVAAGSDALPEGWVWADAEELSGKYAVPSAFACFAPAVRAALAGHFPADC